MTDTENERNEMTTCDKHREAIAADPSYDDGHLSACADCRAFREEMREFDGRIARALSISVPEFTIPELPVLDTSKVSSLPARVSKPAWYALAASVLLAAVLGFRMLGSDIEYASLADEIVAHLDHEPYALRVSDKAVSDSRLARVVPTDVAEMDHRAGLITYAQSCVINGNTVPHLVLQGENGPITILLMPEEKIDGPQSITGESVKGVLLPVGDGSIAILGEEGEDLDVIEKKVRESVSWTT